MPWFRLPSGQPYHRHSKTPPKGATLIGDELPPEMIPGGPLREQPVEDGEGGDTVGADDASGDLPPDAEQLGTGDSEEHDDEGT